jgi:hypothetical protein
MTGFCKIKHHPNPNQTKAAVMRSCQKINTITIGPSKQKKMARTIKEAGHTLY